MDKQESERKESKEGHNKRKAQPNMKKAAMRILSISMRSLLSLELITTDGNFTRHPHQITRVIPITKKEQAFETQEYP